jgi:hypothetical protein
MHDRQTMKTFFAAMTEQTGMGGFGGQIKSTPMGPFKWNDYTQLWENVNNGMVMNNISFQDMVAMDYVSVDGGAVIPTGILYGTIPMVFDPTSYSITSNWEAGSTAEFLPTIQVPTGYPNFDVKFISNGSYGGTLSTIVLSRDRAGTVSTFNMSENTNTPPTPGQNIFAGDLLTFSVKAAGVQAIGVETYTLYFYDQTGATLSNQLTVNVNIPANPTPVLSPTTWNSLANMPDGNTAYFASPTGATAFNGSPTSVSFGLNTIITINLTQTKAFPALDNFDGIYYSISGSAPILYSSGFTLTNAQTLRVGAKAPALSLNGSAGTLNVINVTDSSTVLEAIPYSFEAS